jgi:hypothetical protein
MHVENYKPPKHIFRICFSQNLKLFLAINFFYIEKWNFLKNENDHQIFYQHSSPSNFSKSSSQKIILSKT